MQLRERKLTNNFSMKKRKCKQNGFSLTSTVLEILWLLFRLNKKLFKINFEFWSSHLVLIQFPILTAPKNREFATQFRFFRYRKKSNNGLCTRQFFSSIYHRTQFICLCFWCNNESRNKYFDRQRKQFDRFYARKNITSTFFSSVS